MPKEKRLRPNPCIRCKDMRRKCGLEKPACLRCCNLGLAVQCQYTPSREQQEDTSHSPSNQNSTHTPPTADLRSAGVPEDPIRHWHHPAPIIGLPLSPNFTSPMRNISSQSNIPESNAESLVPSEGRSGGLLSVNSQPLNPSLAQLVQSIEDPIPDDSILDSESLDSDLYPTEEEFNLVTRFLTNDRRALVILATMDGSKFLERYRDQPAALRYTVAAIAAHFMSPSTPEETILSYYRRARMAIFRVIDKPCLETFQALIWITWLSRWKGDPEMGRPFMNAAIQMGHWLRLDVDPDDSPSLKLNVFEAETRRRAFWSLHFLDVTEKTLVVDVDPVVFQPVRMKPLGTVSQIFMASEATQLSFQTYNLIASIKRYYSVAPASLDELIVNQTAEQLTVRLAAVDAAIPSKYKLITAAAEVITSTDIDRFSQQLSFLHPKEYPIVVIGLNMNLFASICMLQRPRMFLTSIKSFDPNTMPTANRTIIAAAINQCFHAAHRITCLIVYLSDMTVGTPQERLDANQRNTFQSHFMSIFPLFEAVITFWFMSCRMDPRWWIYLERGNCPRDALRERLLNVLAFVKGSQPVDSGMLKPIVKCIEAMYFEMDRMEKRVPIVTHVEDAEELLCGMKVHSVGADKGGDGQVKEPWAFMGLLGLDVAGGVRWFSKQESQWRNFWAST